MPKHLCHGYVTGYVTVYNNSSTGNVYFIVPTLSILSKLLQGELQQKDYQIKVQDIEIREKVAQINRQQRELQALTVSLKMFYCKNRNDQPIIWLLG